MPLSCVSHSLIVFIPSTPVFPPALSAGLLSLQKLSLLFCHKLIPFTFKLASTHESSARAGQRPQPGDGIYRWSEPLIMGIVR